MISFIRSWYSFGDGYLSPSDCVSAAKAAGASAVAYADVDSIAGHAEFSRASAQNKIPLIPGIELTLDVNGDRARAIVLCAGEKQWPAFCDMLAKARRDESRLILDAEDLGVHSIVISGIPGSHLERLLYGHDAAGSVDFVRTIRDYKAPCVLSPMAEQTPSSRQLGEHLKQINCRIIPALPGVLRDGEGDRWNRVRTHIFNMDPVVNPPIISLSEGNDAADLVDRFPWIPRSPEPLPPDVGKQELSETVNRLLTKRWSYLFRDSKDFEESISRCQEEVNYLATCGAAPAVSAALQVSQQVGLGQVYTRGSAAHSVILGAAGVSLFFPDDRDLAPIWRFAHPERSSPGDVDLDVPIEQAEKKRSQALRYIPGTRRMRSPVHATVFGSIAELAAKAGIPHPHKLPAELSQELGTDIDSLRAKSYEALEGQFPSFAQTLASLRPKHTGSMESLLSDLSLRDGRPTHFIPHPGLAFLRKDTAVPATQELQPDGSSDLVLAAPQRDVEPLVMTTVDLLPSVAVSMMQRCMAYRRSQGISSDRSDDAPFFAKTIRERIYSPGLLAGVPHINQHKALLSYLNPQSEEDLTCAMALIRFTAHPDILRDYVQSTPPSKKIIGAPAEHLKKLDALTRRSHGTVLFEEQFTSVLTEICGVPLGKAEELRKNPRDSREEVKSSLMAAGWNNDSADQGCDLLCRAPYLFNYGHARSYASMAEYLAYCKCETPAAFFSHFIDIHRETKRDRRQIAALAHDVRALGASLILDTKNPPKYTQDGPHIWMKVETKVRFSRIVFIGRDLFDPDKNQTPYEQLGFLPDNLHPGVPEKTRTGHNISLPDSLRSISRIPEDPIPVFGYPEFVQKPRETSNNSYMVTLGICSRLGEEPVRVSHFFGEKGKSSGAAQAMQFYHSMTAVKEPQIFHLRGSKGRNKQIYWNVESVTPAEPSPAPSLDDSSCLAFVRSRQVATTKSPEPSQTQEI